MKEPKTIKPISTIKPVAPLTPNQARLAKCKQEVDKAKENLKGERDRQKTKREASTK